MTTKLVIKNDVPETGESLCSTCTWAHIQKGYRQSEEVVYCDYAYPPRHVPFKVSQCTKYNDKTLPSMRQMEKMAWILEVRPGGKVAGFIQASPDEDEE